MKKLFFTLILAAFVTVFLPLESKAQIAQKSPIAPRNGFRVEINGGSPITNFRRVNLDLYGGPDTAKVMISENADFIGARLENYSPTMTWYLSSTAGPKAVYVRFFNDYGAVSVTVVDTIIYQLDPTVIRPERSVLGIKISRLDEIMNAPQISKDRADVMELQDELKREGFLSIYYPSTGSLDPVTKDAMDRYWNSKNTSSTEKIDDTIKEDIPIKIEKNSVRKSILKKYLSAPPKKEPNPEKYKYKTVKPKKNVKKAGQKVGEIVK